jgi:hypothetical protein
MSVPQIPRQGGPKKALSEEEQEEAEFKRLERMVENDRIRRERDNKDK